MTEDEWLALETIENVSPLSWLQDTPNERRIFLFLSAYLPRFMYAQFCPACQRLFPLFERQSEGLVTVNNWRTAIQTEHPEQACVTLAVFRRALHFLRRILSPAGLWSPLLDAHVEVSVHLQLAALRNGDLVWQEQHRVETAEIRRDGVRMLKDIAGNPFRPVACAPEWRTDTVLALARQMYESRDFSAMPILADALQDAGCDSSDVLNHCRDANSAHVRGCWVVDLVLGAS